MHSKLALLVLGVLSAVLPAGAHHAHGNYTTDLVDFEGVVTEMHPVNPHAWIYVSRKNAAGQEQLWALEAGAGRTLRTLEEAGVALKVGDQVKIRCHALRDGSPGCLLGYIKHPDGRIYDYDAQVEIEKPVVLPGF